MSSSNLIAILLCTFNGADFLREQLDSFIDQTHKNWVVHASDDGSTDATRDILKEYQQRLGSRLVILEGPRQGFARNFLSLIQNTAINADYYAFSDQDDIWMADKLDRSLSALLDHPADVAALYCSRTQYIDASGKSLGLSPLFSRPPGLRNALVQSLAGANTMLLNKRGKELLSSTDPDAQIVAHDWLTYLMVSSYQGVIVYDPSPTLLYRQHGGNLIGSNAGVKQRFRRLVHTMTGRFRRWNDLNLKILLPHLPHLSAENRQIIEQFDLARRSPLPRRLGLLMTKVVYRQTLAGNFSLWMAALLNKL